MRNEQIINAWSKIEPGNAADARMLNAIITRNHATGNNKKSFDNKKPLTRKRLAPIAACLVIVVAITVVFGNGTGWFGNRIYTTDLDGVTLNFYKTNMPVVDSLDFGAEVVSRELTAEENGKLFENLEVASHGIFSVPDNTLLHAEGSAGNAKIILAASGTPVTDAIINTACETSEVNGVQVAAGYFITDANSQGVKNIIYIASFDLGDISVYVECGGNENMSEDLRAEIASIIDTLTRQGIANLSAVSETATPSANNTENDNAEALE